jgi:general secretion pathway protein D
VDLTTNTGKAQNLTAQVFNNRFGGNGINSGFNNELSNRIGYENSGYGNNGYGNSNYRNNGYGNSGYGNSGYGNNSGGQPSRLENRIVNNI